MTDNEMMVQEGLVTIEAAREFLDISRASLYRLIDNGTLPTVKLGFECEADSPPSLDRPGGKPGDGRHTVVGLTSGGNGVGAAPQTSAAGNGNENDPLGVSPSGW